MTERRALVLALVIREYVESAQPVASGRLVERYELDVSAATVRNEMAALEELGLLGQPHTSAGRVPTIHGYRYFVERLMHHAGLADPMKRMIRHQFHQAGWDPERWMRLAAAVVARSTGAAGLVASPRDGSSRVRRVDIVDMGPMGVQLIAILANGMVQQARWRPEQPVDRADLAAIAGRVNDHLERGLPLPAPAADRPPLENDALTAIAELVGRAERPASPRLYHAGLTQILYAPEFADSDRLREVVGLLEHGRGLEDIFEGVPAGGVHVFIGGEPPLEEVPYVTLVLSRFGQQTTPAGVLGVVGPTRMAYEQAVPTVGFVASLMTRLLAGEPAA